MATSRRNQRRNPSLASIAVTAWLCLSGLASAQNDPIKNFCRRWGHSTAVVDKKLYINGGFITYSPFSAAAVNTTNTYLTSNDLSIADSFGMPPVNSSLSKNASIPSTHGGILWEDSVNKRLYAYGGESAQPSAFDLFSYDILKDNWISHGAPQGAQSLQPTSYGAGVSVPSRGEAYYYGGWMNNGTVPGWGTGAPVATTSLIKYSMDTNTFTNLTGPDDNIRRADGAMVFLPIGDAGMLVYFGGSQDLLNGNVTAQPMNEILLYDLAGGRWYKQKTTGRTPEPRRRFCAGATWAQDQSSFNIYLYGGGGFPGPNAAGFDDIYVLSIPSFTWIRSPFPSNSNLTGEYPKSMMTCNAVNGNSQMLIIGGYASNTTGCDATDVKGLHNANLGLDNPDKAIWHNFLPTLTTYTVPTFIISTIGGGPTGGIVAAKPTAGWDQEALNQLMTRRASMPVRTPTRDTGEATNTSPAGAGGPALGTGPIAGIAAGASVAVIGFAAFIVFCALKRRKQAALKEVQRRASAQDSHAGLWAATPSMHRGPGSVGPNGAWLPAPQLLSPTPSSHTGWLQLQQQQQRGYPGPLQRHPSLGLQRHPSLGALNAQYGYTPEMAAPGYIDIRKLPDGGMWVSNNEIAQAQAGAWGGSPQDASPPPLPHGFGPGSRLTPQELPAGYVPIMTDEHGWQVHSPVLGLQQPNVLVQTQGLDAAALGTSPPAASPVGGLGRMPSNPALRPDSNALGNLNRMPSNPALRPDSNALGNSGARMHLPTLSNGGLRPAPPVPPRDPPREGHGNGGMI